MRTKNRKSPPAKIIDIEKLRADMVSECDRSLNDLITLRKSFPSIYMIDLMNPIDRKSFLETVQIHNEIISVLQRQKSFLLKAKNTKELCRIFDEMSHGIARSSTRLDEVLKDTINDSRRNLDRIRSKRDFH